MILKPQKNISSKTSKDLKSSINESLRLAWGVDGFTSYKGTHSHSKKPDLCKALYFFYVSFP